MNLLPFRGRSPVVDDTVFIAPTVSLIGDVAFGSGSSAFYGATVRADTSPIRIGEGTNLQDNVVVHADPGHPALIGRRVRVGHSAVVHGCHIEDDCLIGMHATIMNGAVIGTESIIAAGAVVLEGTHVPPRSLVAGVPGKVRRSLTDDEVQGIKANAERYRDLAQEHRRMLIIEQDQA